MLVNSGELKLSPEWRIGSHSRELPKAKGSLHPEADLEDDEEEGPWPEEAVSHPRPHTSADVPLQGGHKTDLLASR